MVRPLRLEFSEKVYQVTLRRDRREDIFLNDGDRSERLSVLSLVCDRFDWIVYASGQLTNHYHLLVATVDGSLLAGMRQLNGLNTQKFNLDQ